MSVNITTHRNISEIHRLDDDIVDEIIRNMRRVLHDEDINFSGKLSQSIESKTVDGVRHVIVNSPYATVVDKGMAPGTNVNFDALKNWVENKLQVPSDQSNDVTIRIMNKIRTTGIKPKFYAKKSLKMLIAKHGVVRVRNKKRNQSSFEKRLNKAVKISRKIAKIVRKANRNINKINKFIKSTRV